MIRSQLKFANAVPPQALLNTQGLYPWVDEVNKEAGGAFEIKTFPGPGSPTSPTPMTGRRTASPRSRGGYSGRSRRNFPRPVSTASPSKRRPERKPRSVSGGFSRTAPCRTSSRRCICWVGALPRHLPAHEETNPHHGRSARREARPRRSRDQPHHREFGRDAGGDSDFRFLPVAEPRHHRRQRRRLVRRADVQAVRGHQPPSRGRARQRRRLCRDEQGRL